MKKLVVAALTALIIIACNQEPKPMSWQLAQTIELDGVNPIGLTHTEDGLWLSDGDHNRVVLIDGGGKVMSSIDSLERPMHITSQDGGLIIPEYGKDAVTLADGENLMRLQWKDSLDAPAGVWVNGDEMAVADFYNHRVLYAQDGENWISIGKEGKAEGEFYYPTDVQFTEDKIWVADAYNNRIQVFDKEGNFLKVIGTEEKMNAATGIYVSDSEVFITDFENDRVLVFDHEGGLKQVVSDKINKPTDILVVDGRLHIINYRNSLVNVFDWKETPETEERDEHEDHDHEHD